MIDEVSNGLFPSNLTFVMAKFYCFFFFLEYKVFLTHIRKEERIFFKEIYSGIYPKLSNFIACLKQYGRPRCCVDNLNLSTHQEI